MAENSEKSRKSNNNIRGLLNSEPFNLTNEEAYRIAQQCQIGRQILARHGVM